MAAGRTDATERGYYLYAIAGAAPQLDGVRGVDGTSPVFTVEGAGLNAVVSEVPLAEFGEEALKERLEELPWLEKKVRAHEDVLERAAGETSILPLRFGTIYRSLEPVRELLERRREALGAALAQLDGKREWGVKATLDRERLRAAVEDRDATAALEGASPGTAFFARKRLERDLDDQAKALAGRLAADAHLRLAAVADESVRDGGALLKSSYLVDRDRERPFRDALDEVAAAGARYGFRYELTGPWPPYSFVGSVTG
jgi:Gas vesicle synthesis protein GvpL/GvpF